MNISQCFSWGQGLIEGGKADFSQVVKSVRSGLFCTIFSIVIHCTELTDYVFFKIITTSQLC